MGTQGLADVVPQLLGYALPDDDFGCVVMVDRQARPLQHEYWEIVLQNGTIGVKRWPAGPGDNTGKITYPAFVTEHPRPTGTPLRIYHFLVQLPPD